VILGDALANPEERMMLICGVCGMVVMEMAAEWHSGEQGVKPLLVSRGIFREWNLRRTVEWKIWKASFISAFVFSVFIDINSGWNQYE